MRKNGAEKNLKIPILTKVHSRQTDSTTHSFIKRLASDSPHHTLAEPLGKTLTLHVQVFVCVCVQQDLLFTQRSAS